MKEHRHISHAGLFVLLFCFCGAAACSGDPPGASGTSGSTASGSTASSSGSGTGGSGAGGGGGAGIGGGAGGEAGSGGSGGGTDCPTGSHDDGTGACVTTLAAWAAGPSLGTARDHHVTFAVTTPSGPFLFAAGGGNNSGLLTGIERAPIADDGSLGAFVDGGKLLRAVAGAGLTQIDRTVVLAGGLGMEGVNAVSIVDTVIGTVADDGAIAFVAGPPLLSSRYHLTLSADSGYVYAIGGLFQTYVNGQLSQTVSDAVERASFDGKVLGDFTALTPLPVALTHHAAVVYKHALYLIGGLTTSTARTDVLRATIDPSGELGAWETVGNLPEGRATSAAFVFLDRLYVVAGATKAQGGEVATVLRASFDADGKVGAFEELAALPKARAHAHQAPVVGTTIYSAGGSINHNEQKNVYIGHLE